MRSTRSSRLSAYADTASARPIIGGSAVAGMAVAALANPAAADLQIWSVGLALPQIASSDPASMDINLTASFSAAFRINFFGTGAGDSQVFWAPNDNLSFINFFDTNSPAIWVASMTVDANALAGIASNSGTTTHEWRHATSSHAPRHFIQTNIFAGETGAFGIRFIDGSDYYYGWVEVSEDANGIITVERWALQDTANTGAQYLPSGGGAVPGLGGLAALAMGAGGVRRKRQRVA